MVILLDECTGPVGPDPMSPRQRIAPGTMAGGLTHGSERGKWSPVIGGRSARAVATDRRRGMRRILKVRAGRSVLALEAAGAPRRNRTFNLLD